MRSGRCAAGLLIGAVVGCGGAPGPSSLRAAPATYLLGVDQLVAPDFTLDSAPHTLSVADVTAGDAARAAALTSNGFTGGAAEDFFRQVASIDVANGPVQIGDTVVEFTAAAGAMATYTDDVRLLDGVPGATAVSTGSLGDVAHATTRMVTAPGSGVQLVEITIEWRVDNLLDILVVRGRSGGIRPDDALILAHTQTSAELGLATPTPLPTPSPSQSPSASPS